MKLENGYKDSDVGLIPIDWDFDCVKNLADITTGAKNTQDRINDGVYPFFVRSQEVERIDSFSFDGEAVLTAGDGVGTGKVFHYINGKFDFHQRVYRISQFDKKLNGYYFFVYFSNHFYNRIVQMTAKSSVDSVRMEMIAKMPIPLPPIKEQEAIAEALGDIASLIDSLDRLITKKRNIKQGAKQELLTGVKRVAGYSDAWQPTTLGELGSFKRGKGIKKDAVIPAGLPCIRYGEIYTVHNEYIKKINSFISLETAASSQKIKKGDLLFAGSGETAEEIGKCIAYLDDSDAYAGGDVLVFSPYECDSLFLGFLLNQPSVVKQKSQLAQGDAVVHIYIGSLKKIDLAIPKTTEEQSAIACMVCDMDREIQGLELQLNKYQFIKQGMMQELLTGKTRLI